MSARDYKLLRDKLAAIDAEYICARWELSIKREREEYARKKKALIFGCIVMGLFLLGGVVTLICHLI